MKRRSFLIASGGTAAAVALTACGGGDEGGSNPSGGGTRAELLTLGSIQQCSTFNAANARWANESFYMQAVYDTLLRADPKGKVGPGLATEWKYNDAATELTLTLQTGIKFTDGTDFNAEAAAQNLTRFKAGTSPNKSLLSAMKEAKATDDKTLVITLDQADPGLLVGLTRNAGVQMSPAAFNSPDVDQTPVGTGPYTLDKDNTTVGTTYSFKRNPDYWDGDNVHYENLVVNVYNEPTAILNAAKSGQINGSNTLDKGSLDQYKAANFTLNINELDWQGVILFDRGGAMNPALKDVRVRQAICYAFDREALLKEYAQGYGSNTTQVFPERSVGFDSSLDSMYPYDPAKAKALLAEAGYANGLTLDMPSSSLVGATLFALIEQQLKDVGITPKFTTTNDYIADMLAPKYPAAWMSLQQDEDWGLIKFQIGPKATWNPFKYEDPKVDEYISKVLEYSKDNTSSDYKTAVHDLNAYIVEQAWFSVWYRAQLVFVTDDKTQVEVQAGNAIPYLWNIKPK